MDDATIRHLTLCDKFFSQKRLAPIVLQLILRAVFRKHLKVSFFFVFLFQKQLLSLAIHLFFSAITFGYLFSFEKKNSTF